MSKEKVLKEKKVKKVPLKNMKEKRAEKLSKYKERSKVNRDMVLS